MTWVQSGNCPKCGAPIYTTGKCYSADPPPPYYTCVCYVKDYNIKDTNESKTYTINIQENS